MLLASLRHLLLAAMSMGIASAKPMVGIDLGTTYSAVAVFKDGRAEIIANDLGQRTTPSWVAFTEQEILVGDAAKNQASMNPENTVFDAKRFIGRRFDEKKIQQDLKEKKIWPFKIVDSNGNPAMQVKYKGESKTYAPEQISSMILGKMKEIAEAYTGSSVTDVVITIPAYFNDAQRQATKDAATIAGLNALRIINEPTAAALAYGLQKTKTAKVAVFDLGGGTFDISILQIDDGVFEVLATNGDPYLGGQDFDNNIIQYIQNEIKKKHNVDVSDNKRLLGKLRREAEKVKRELSSTHQATIEIDGIKTSDGSTIDYVGSLTRARFEDMNMDLFKKTIPLLEKALADAKCKPGEINEVIMVGGSTRIPKVQQLVQDFFKGKELNKSVNPDEAVAQGAAIQASILAGDKSTQNLLVLDTTPLGMGIETAGGVLTILIPRNTLIPAKKTQIFSTFSDNQDTVDINVFEGERPMAKDNHFLGHFYLRGIPLAPRGVPQIEVTFEVNADGILKVSAKDLGSGNSESVTITADKRRLNESEIQKMIKEAEENKEHDQKMKEKLEARNSFENYLFTLKSQVNDEKSLGSKLSADDKKSVVAALDEKIKWLDEHKESAIKEDFEEQKAAVEKTVAPIISKLYGGADSPPPRDAAKAADHEDL